MFTRKHDEILPFHGLTNHGRNAAGPSAGTRGKTIGLQGKTDRKVMGVGQSGM